MVRIILSLLVSLLFAYAATGQDTAWAGEIVSKADQSPLIGVNIFDQEKRLGTTTDLNGRFRINITDWPVAFEVSYLGHKTIYITADKPNDLPKRIVLQTEAATLREVVISSTVTPIKVTEASRSVVDFILFDEYLLYVESTGRGNRSNLVLSANDGTVLDVTRLADYPLFEFLFKSCQGVPYVVCEHKVYELAIDNSQLTIAYQSGRRDFDAFVEPCKAKTSGFLYHSLDAFDRQVVTINQVDLKTYNYKPFAELYDTTQLQAFMRAHRLIDMYSGFVEHTEDSFFEERIYTEMKHLELFAQPVNYDLFAVGDSVLIINYQQNHISYYGNDRQHLKDVPIYYNQHKRWTGTVLQDATTGGLYVLIKDEGHIVVHSLDIANGSLNYLAHTKVDFLDKMKVHGGKLWYTTSKAVGQVTKQLHRLDVG